MRLFLAFRLLGGPLTTLWQPGGPIKGLDPEPVALQRIAKLLGQLPCLAGLIRVGKACADPVLLQPCSGRIGRPRWHRRPQTHPGTRHIEGDSVPDQLQSGVLAAEPGVGGGHRICLRKL